MVLSRIFTILFSMAALLVPCRVHASQSVNLAWNQNSEQNIAGYRVYFGTSSSNYTQTQEAVVPVRDSHGAD